MRFNSDETRCELSCIGTWRL